MTKKQSDQRPVWWDRQYLGPFVLSEEEAWRIIDSPPWMCAIAWVTGDCQPVVYAMAYRSLTKRSCSRLPAIGIRSNAFGRKPAVSVCSQSEGLKRVTVRGQVELSDDRSRARRWSEPTVESWSRRLTPEEQQLEIAHYDSPDRTMIIVRIDRVRTFDGQEMFQSEAGELQSIHGQTKV